MFYFWMSKWWKPELHSIDRHRQYMEMEVGWCNTVLLYPELETPLCKSLWNATCPDFTSLEVLIYSYR